MIKNKFDIKVYLDFHGALEDIIEVSKRATGFKAIILRTLYHLDKKAIGQGVAYSDGFFVVTDALKQYIVDRFDIENDKQFYVVPCATSASLINDKEFEVDREVYRQKYNIAKDDIVFIYSGGVSSWQCVSESIELFKDLADKLGNHARMLVFSHNIDAIKSLIKGDPRILTDCYTPDELFHALRAGDFAFLLRRDNLTNNVAFPNKYLEYVQSGMRIITTPYIKEVSKQVKEYKIGYIYDFGDGTDALLNYVQNNLGNNGKELINSVLTVNSFESTIKAFAEGYINDN